MHIIHWWSDWHRVSDPQPIMRDGKKIGERALYRSYCYKSDTCGKTKEMSFSAEDEAPESMFNVGLLS